MPLLGQRRLVCVNLFYVLVYDVQGLFLCLLDLAVKLLVGCFAVLLFAAALVAGLDFDVQVLVNDFRALHDVRRWRALFLLNRRVGVVL